MILLSQDLLSLVWQYTCYLTQSLLLLTWLGPDPSQASIIEAQTVHSLRPQCLDMKHLAGRNRAFGIVVADRLQEPLFMVSVLADRTELDLLLRESKLMGNMIYMVHRPKGMWTRGMNNQAGFLIASDMLCICEAILVGHLLHLLQVATDSNRLVWLYAAILLLAAPLMLIQQPLLAGDGLRI